MQTPRTTFLRTLAAGAASVPLLSPDVAAAADPAASPSKMMGKAKFIDVSGIRTRYFDGGKGVPLVMIHGGQWPSTSSCEQFTALFDLLAAHYHVYVFDKLGAGFTDNPKTDADYSMDAVVRHAYGFITAAGITTCILAGHSRGALPAARIAVDHPELVSHLVIFDTNALASDEFKLSERPDPPPVAGVPSRDAIRRADLASPLSVNKAVITDAWVDAEYRIAQLPKLAEADRKFRALRDQWIHDNPEKMRENPMLGNNMGAVVWWMIESKHETLALIRAGKLKAPTAIIWGWNDPFAPYALGLDTMKTISAVNERTEMHFVNHAGHFVFAEQPEAAARHLISFVSANEPFRG